MKSIALSTALLFSAAALVAQGPPPPQQGGGDTGPRDMMMRDRGMMRDHMREGGMHEWWRNPMVAQRVGLSQDQIKKLDDTVLQSRIQLIHLHASLEEEELKLRPLMDANPLDQRAAMAQIDKIAETRASLEKANAKMLLDERAVLSADQWTKLQEGHREMMRHDGGMRGQGGNPNPRPRGNNAPPAN